MELKTARLTVLVYPAKKMASAVCPPGRDSFAGRTTSDSRLDPTSLSSRAV
jgi:hypothetical protein